MTPKLSRLDMRLRDLKSKVDHRADELLERVDRAESRSDAAFDKAHHSLDKHEADLREIEDFVGQVDNGGPLTGGGSGS